MLNPFPTLLLLLYVILAANHISGGLIGASFPTVHKAKDLPMSEENDDQDPDCTRSLPKHYETPVEEENPVNIVEFLNGGYEAFMSENEHSFENATITLVNTGCGKTTLTQLIASNLTQLHAVLTNSEELVTINHDEFFGVPKILSRRLLPELVVSLDDDSKKYCPGFDDNRGPQKHLAGFMNQLPTKVKRVKMMFVVKHSSVQLGKSQLEFDLLAQYATKYVKEMWQFRNSIGLVVTKVSKYFYPNPALRKLKEEETMGNIVEFLTIYNQRLHRDLRHVHPLCFPLRTKIEQKIEFVDILLQKDSSGKYDRIAVFRIPDEYAPNNSSVPGLGIKALELCDRLEYSPVGDTKQNFGYTLKYKNLIDLHKYNKGINDNITAKVTEAVENFTQTWKSQWNDANITKDDVQAVATELENRWLDISKLLELLPQTPSRLAFSLEEVFQKFGYTLPDEFLRFMREQEDYLCFLDTSTGTRVDSFVEAWYSPVRKLKQVLSEYWDGYNFCLNVKRTVESADFHLNRPPLTVPLPIPIPITPITQVNKISDEIMQWVMEPVKIFCDDSSFVNIIGNFIRFADFIDFHGHLDFGGCNKAYSIINVYAADTVFIDEDLNAVGKRLDLVVVAPQWQVIRKSHLNLNGENAVDIEPRQAKSGVEASDGAAGIPGKPGGSGGNFLGIAGKIRGADKLIISSSGGNGSRGQDGGNGRRGRNGGTGRTGEIMDDNHGKFIAVVYDGAASARLGEKGFNGGRGGDGGAGGFGGKSGSIQIIAPLNDAKKVNVQHLEGKTGPNGMGGKGGRGGRGSSNNYCKNLKFGSIYVKAYCDDTKHPDGDTGSNGISGGNAYGREQPVQSRLVVGVEAAQENFRRLFTNSVNKATTDFIATF